MQATTEQVNKAKVQGRLAFDNYGRIKLRMEMPDPIESPQRSGSGIDYPAFMASPGLAAMLRSVTEKKSAMAGCGCTNVIYCP